MRRRSADDSLLRLIRELGSIGMRIAGMRQAGQNQASLDAIADAERALLGPVADTVALLDSATAAHILGEPLRIAGWSVLLRQRAETLRTLGAPADAALLDARAAELADHARARAEPGDHTIDDILRTDTDAPPAPDPLP